MFAYFLKLYFWHSYESLISNFILDKISLKKVCGCSCIPFMALLYYANDQSVNCLFSKVESK